MLHLVKLKQKGVTAGQALRHDKEGNPGGFYMTPAGLQYAC